MPVPLTRAEREVLAEAAKAGEVVARTYHRREQDAAGSAKQAACEALVKRRLLHLERIEGSPHSTVDDVLWRYGLTPTGRSAAGASP